VQGYENELAVLSAVCRLMAREISGQPAVRKFIRDEYRKVVTVSTTPTEKGKRELTVFHPLFRVKRVVNK